MSHKLRKLHKGIAALVAFLAILGLTLIFLLAGCSSGSKSKLIVIKDSELVLLALSGEQSVFAKPPKDFTPRNLVVDSSGIFVAVYGQKNAGLPKERDAILVFADGRLVRDIDDVKSDVGGPSFSPRGDKLAYVSGRDLVIERTRDGGQKKKETGYGNISSEPVWSPVSNEILILTAEARKDLPENNRLWIVDPSTGRRREVAKNLKGKQPFGSRAGGTIWNPWSPDGKKLVILTKAILGEPGQSPAMTLRLYDIETNKNKVLAAAASGAWKMLWPGSWSPDGLKFTYSSNLVKPTIRDSDLFIHDMSSGGTEAEVTDNLLQGPGYWSPDGAGIVYNSSSVGENKKAGLYILDLKSKEKERLGPQRKISADSWLK